MVTEKTLRNIEIINKENVGGDLLPLQGVHWAKKKYMPSKRNVNLLSKQVEWHLKHLEKLRNPHKNPRKILYRTS